MIIVALKTYAGKEIKIWNKIFDGVWKNDTTKTLLSKDELNNKEIKIEIITPNYYGANVDAPRGISYFYTSYSSEQDRFTFTAPFRAADAGFITGSVLFSSGTSWRLMGWYFNGSTTKIPNSDKPFISKIWIRNLE